jgi:hydroxysqualene synthase
VNDAASVESWSGKDRQDENFPVGSWLIHHKVRPHVHAFYGFARNADDIADSAALSPEEKVSRLDIMEDVLLGRSDAGSPSALRLRESLAQTGVTSRHACELLIAFRRDAIKKRYATVDELDDYCRYSAAPVGRYVLDLHGESDRAYAPSDALCQALQILNHMQDCVRDLKTLDRCYIPETMLVEFGCSIADLHRPDATDGMRHVFDSLLQGVDQMTRIAIDLPKRTRDRRLRLETAVILGLAIRLASRLKNEDPIAGRVRLKKIDVAGSIFYALRFV